MRLILACVFGLFLSVCTAKQSCEGKRDKPKLYNIEPNFFSVCESVLQRFEDYAGSDVEDMGRSETALKKFCKTLNGRDERFVSQSVVVIQSSLNLNVLVLLHWSFRNISN